ncbi:MAG: phosphatidylcholine/phosphatidylserine synthase [Holosporaceae bacterium]|jgi:CDP-diacylglycerol--serine O-phosphatidyltransferase|nr:phosphatidylcholine/phosphatidylserine synthase [Holosporaceae bacterium]
MEMDESKGQEQNLTESEEDDSSDKQPARKVASLTRFLPSIITVAALCVGLTSIRFALFHRWEMAVLCIFVAALLDALDGRVARYFGYSSQLGAQLDSLSDLVCFGVAPAVVLFLKSMYLFSNIGWAICMFFTVCCALRLARFNADLFIDAPMEDWERKYFKGVPAPAGAILAVFPMILSFHTGDHRFLYPEWGGCCLAVAGLLMISSARTFSSKMIVISERSAPFSLMAAGCFVICLITEVWLTLSILVVTYLCSIPFGAMQYYRTLQKKVEPNAETQDVGTETYNETEALPAEDVAFQNDAAKDEPAKESVKTGDPLLPHK